jgi:hypothetical protein
MTTRDEAKREKDAEILSGVLTHEKTQYRAFKK